MRLALLAVVTGCSFSGPVAGSAQADGPDAAAPDAREGTTPDAPTTPSFAPCATSDTNGLVACYEFEDDFTSAGTIHDSSANHLDATAHGLATASRNSSHAAAITTTDATYVPQVPALDRPDAFTLALWVNPSALPASGSVMGLLDHEDQYALLIGRSSVDVTARCVLTGLSEYEWVDGLPANQWSMLACSWDGTNLCAYRWTSATDHTRNCFVPGESPAPTGSHGLAIGSLSTGGAPHDRFSGALDSIHIYDRALSQSSLCSAVGQSAGCMR